ncbi:hypothetical protein KIPB_011394 [Kipferlia bialata]|uniref:EGF-like domain-containing protein n=1 Tax=Kipferlia bialata TaxID=797122 RepID=A0A9K3D7G9_9EUKA|nr:hypothetical protein KIPB_011394 [Kipferlia bialata]|eukprot:g11394.t1
MTDIDCGSYGTLTDGACDCVLGWAGTLCDENEIYMTVLYHVMSSWWFWTLFAIACGFMIWVQTQFWDGEEEEIHGCRTWLAAMIQVCCAGNTLVLG